MFLWHNKIKTFVICNSNKIEVNTMAISYKKLWKLLIDRDMKKKDLMALAGVSQSSITKMGHNDNVKFKQKIIIQLSFYTSFRQHY